MKRMEIKQRKKWAVIPVCWQRSVTKHHAVPSLLIVWQVRCVPR